MKQSGILSVVKIRSIIFVLILMLAATPGILNAQDTALYFPPRPIDTSLLENPHSPHKATIYSLVLPGLGQAYNKKYWKIPVIYAGFTFLVYNIKVNNDEVKKFTQAYKYVINKETYPTDNKYVVRYPNPSDLQAGRAFYRRKVELNIIYSAAWYVLNVLDAAVDAHFFDYDISDNLSLHLEPAWLPAPDGNYASGAQGIKLCLKF
ncbi:MAG: DUF5683 domain-containing protein [Lentimicrobiaceae bacterium]|jgi:hypothetical protein|nr:DUF5683 domain-containing protein [Lentimicrobiaceae bacterium]MDY0026859.1 DUF5683 domain-containing protein [Lentimicrobium sp.]